MFQGLESSSFFYSRMIEEHAKMSTVGIASELPWEWCYRENATYLDCPISNHDGETNMIIAVHNPSPVDIKYPKIAIAHGSYDI